MLRKLMGDPAMTEHLGGPENEEQLAIRQRRYERLEDPSAGRMYKIVDEVSGDAIGSVGYWEKEWRNQTVYEAGWSVIPGFQGRGVAVAATAQAIEHARSQNKHRYLHAFPSVDNAASNAICRKLGFKFLETCDFEFPKGHFMCCNDWRLDLFAESDHGDLSGQ